MKKLFKALACVVSAVLLCLALKTPAYAWTDNPGYFDFEESTMSVNAGSTRTISMTAYYDYTYYIGPHTSTGTYLECSFNSGTQNITFHIGADEQVKNVFFYFYITDDKVQATEIFDAIEIYVQNVVTTYQSLSVPIAGGRTGTLGQTGNGNVAMLFNDSGVGLASFSLTNGNGSMASLGITGVVNNGSNYFAVTSGSNSSPVISESDKQVMLANGYAGVCVNGVYKNW